jgi:hypothetical protein
MEQTPRPTEKPSEDSNEPMIEGAAAIAEFIYSSRDPRYLRKIYHLAETRPRYRSRAWVRGYTSDRRLIETGWRNRKFRSIKNAKSNEQSQPAEGLPVEAPSTEQSQSAEGPPVEVSSTV